MLKTFTVVLLAIAMPVCLAHAHGMGHHMHRHMIPGCAMGPAAATCACGTAANHRPHARCERTQLMPVRLCELYCPKRVDLTSNPGQPTFGRGFNLNRAEQPIAATAPGTTLLSSTEWR